MLNMHLCLWCVVIFCGGNKQYVTNLQETQHTHKQLETKFSNSRSCAETLAFLQPESSVMLISESSLIKTVTNLHAVTKTLTSFDVEEKEAIFLMNTYSNVTVLHDTLAELNTTDKVLITKSNKQVYFTYLCICTGAQPNIIPQAVNSEYCIRIRDTDSVENFISKLSISKRVVIVGNGGIASEIIYKIRNTDVQWVLKDKHISATFVDPGAAEFFQHTLNNPTVTSPSPAKHMRYKDSSTKSGAALGPDWYKDLEIYGASSLPRNITVHYQTEIKDITPSTSEFPLKVHLTNEQILDCDLIISATGVIPQKNFSITGKQLNISEDGAIKVNEFMETSVKNIYAAGDICHPNWEYAKHWFPMKLWTQARQMGCYVAKCMSAAHNEEEIYQDFCFEVFAHSTKLFGYKVILLGLYNGQKLGQDYEILLRITKGMEYIKFVLQNNKLQGAVLIGETDLEEMCENLILNQIDLSPYGDDILNPNIDIEDYFD